MSELEIVNFVFILFLSYYFYFYLFSFLRIRVRVWYDVTTITHCDKAWHLSQSGYIIT